jgi:hypothetical protein
MRAEPAARPHLLTTTPPAPAAPAPTWHEPAAIPQLPATERDRAAAAIAARQGGVISAKQLRDVGLNASAVRLRAERGRLIRLHRGVYAYGHAQLTLDGHLWAAVLACGGPGAAALSHRTGAAAWDLLPFPIGRLELITFNAGRSTAQLRVHRSRTLDPEADVVLRGGLPVTTVARTLLDLAAVLSPHRLERLVGRAELLRLFDLVAIEAAIERAPRNGPRLRAAIAAVAARPPEYTRSPLEDRFLELVDRFALPRPLVNAQVNGVEVDFVWPEHRLIVETDGAAAHLTRRAFQDDRRRDARHQLAGYRVLRYTDADVDGRPAEVAAEVAALTPPELAALRPPDLASLRPPAPARRTRS